MNTKELDFGLCDDGQLLWVSRPLTKGRQALCNLQVKLCDLCSTA